MARKKEDSAELLAPDPFLGNMKRWSTWTEKHLKVLVATFAACLAVVVGFEFFNSQGQRDAAVVTAKLSDAVKAYEEATDPQKIMSSTTAGALDHDLEAARSQFAAVSKDHPGHGASHLAKLYEADIARRLGKHADAEALYKSYVSEAKPDDTLLFLALEGAGYALEEQGKLDESVDYFSRLGNDASGFYKDYGLKHKARVLEKKGDKQGAAAAYQAIVAIDPPSDLRPQAEERLKTLQP